MNKIRVIDLLNKIANGEEVPKEIKLYTNKYQYYEDIKDYKVEDIDNYWLIKDFIETYDDLTEEVAIIEDTPKKKNIKEIFALNTDSYAEDVYYEKLSKEEICLDIQSLKHKINEIIDKINGE